jgi:small nuclear ribonucleoprotein D3
MPERVGVPIKILHEAEGHTVTVELKTGEVFRGKLEEAEDNMNCQMSHVTRTAKDGKVTTLSACFLRGSQVRFIVMPDILKNAPVFKKVVEAKAFKQGAAKQRKLAAAKARTAGGASGAGAVPKAPRAR